MPALHAVFWELILKPNPLKMGRAKETKSKMTYFPKNLQEEYFSVSDKRLCSTGEHSYSAGTEAGQVLKQSR